MFLKSHFLGLKKFLLQLTLRILRECYADLRSPQEDTWQGKIPQARPLPNGSLRIYFYIDSLTAGGAERQLVWLACELSKRGHAVTVLCTTLDGANTHFLQLLHQKNITIHQLQRLAVPAYMKEGKKIFGSLRALRIVPSYLRINSLSLVHFLLHNPCDVLHCYLDAPNCVGGTAGVLTGVPIVRLSTRSFSPAHYLWHSSDTYEYFRHCYKTLWNTQACTFEANSAVGARDYEKWINIPAYTFDVLHNGITHEFIPNTVTKDYSQDAPTLICVQRITHVKRPTLPIQILKEVVKEFPKTHLLYVGSGPCLNDVEQCIAKLQVSDHVTLVGESSNVSNWLTKGHIFLLTSILEGFPNVIMEAMLAELPIVATKVGGVPELVQENAHGILIETPQEDTEESLSLLAQEMGKAVIELWKKPQRAQEMGKAGRAHVLKSFSIETLGDKLEKKYQYNKCSLAQKTL